MPEPIKVNVQITFNNLILDLFVKSFFIFMWLGNCKILVLYKKILVIDWADKKQIFSEKCTQEIFHEITQNGHFQSCKIEGNQSF